MDKSYEITEKVLEFCKSYFKEYGYAPTVREIGKGVGISSTSGVHRHMQRLFKEGKLATDHPGQSRAFRITV
ncbi:MAG TPA: hypothetical protein DCW90_03585 [Lachnospiraceae bacterium]|nr:hypothetical protein [Lachnospiraceae bacterium]